MGPVWGAALVRGIACGLAKAEAVDWDAAPAVSRVARTSIGAASLPHSGSASRTGIGLAGEIGTDTSAVACCTSGYTCSGRWVVAAMGSSHGPGPLDLM